MNKKGFISMTLVYTFLILFLFLMLSVMHAYSEKNKFLDTIDDKIDLRLTTPTNYGITILQALLNKYEAEESGIIDYSKNSEGSYYSNGSLVQNISATSNGFYFTQVVDDEDNNKIHMTEDDKTLYFFRGVAEQNYIEFANYCWRIFRTNENEGARLVLYGNYSEGSGCTLNESILPQAAYNLVSNNNAYVGYMYGSNSTDYNITHANINNSSIKSALDTWYENKLLDTKYEKYIDDNIFCNDREIGQGGSFNGLTYYMNGTGTSNTIYQSFRRNATGGKEGTSISMSSAYPVFICSKQEDKFTKSNTKGNTKLTYPIGTLTADELVISGTSFKTGNSSFFLNYGLNIWTMTPSTFTSGVARAISMQLTGELVEAPVTSIYYVLPVISLKNTTLISAGDGTKINPFRVKVS